MRLAVFLFTGFVVLGTGLALAWAAVSATYGMPVLCVLLLLWLTFVEYMLAKSWWIGWKNIRSERERSV